MPSEVYRFEDFELDPSAFRLTQKGRHVQIERIPLEVLCFLVDHAGQIVTREAILEQVWGKGVFLDAENSINTAVRKIRRALSDDSEMPRFVSTVPTRGYRFISKLRSVETPMRLHSPSTATVGRKREIGTFRAAIQAAARGRGGMFLISGEPGIGKTRLIEEIVALAQRQELRVLLGRCVDDDEAVPYLPFVEMLESCATGFANGSALRTLLGEEGPELARLMPKLRRLMPDLPQPPELPAEQARRNLYN